MKERKKKLRPFVDAKWEAIINGWRETKMNDKLYLSALRLYVFNKYLCVWMCVCLLFFLKQITLAISV